MEVEAVQMYREGVRIPDDELKQVEPVRGELALNSIRAELLRLPVAPNGADDRCRYLFLPLAWARITRVAGSRMLVSGFEINSRRVPGELPQVWLCTVISA